jgi:SPP1 gp7 family putative phage head morphogenesis protein
MTSLEYWKDRERAAAEEYAVQDEEALRRTQDVYLRLMASINDRINAFYARYAASEGITMNLAEMAVSQFDVKAFEATAAKMVADKDFSPQANAQLKIYNATMRINRLEMLKAYIGLDTIAAGEELVQLDERYLTERCREEFERQAGILGESIRPTRKDVDAIVHSSFYNATFSQRIWANMSELHDELSTILTNGIIQGINPREMTSRLTERFQVSESDAERLLRTEMARVQTETQRQSFQMAGFEYYVFISLEGRACPVCAALDTGEPIPLEDFMPGETAPPVHPNCVLPDTKIMAPDAETIMRAEYSGNIIEVRTANGRRLRVTPNHIVLTPRGWVAAKHLVEGDEVVYYRGDVVNGSVVKPTDDNSTPSVEDLFAAAVKASGGPTCRVPSTAVALKGDVLADSKIDIVGINSKLRCELDASLRELVSDRSLILTGESGEGLLPTERTMAELLVCIGLAADGIMSGADILRVFRSGALRHHELVGLRQPSHYDARLLEAASNHRAADSEALRELIDGLAGVVATDKIVSVRENYFSGHVYDTSCISTLYTCNSIIASNCRCSVAAWMYREQMEKELGFALDEEEDPAMRSLFDSLRR